MLTRLAILSDAMGILELQSFNLFDRLQPSARSNGFVTTPFVETQLYELIEQRGLFVAEKDQKIVGYTMAAGWHYFSQWEIFPFMINRLLGQTIHGTRITIENSFQYGPICIDSSMRGSSLFPELFETMRLELRNRYPIGLTFINCQNERSYQAHTKKLGLEVVDKFDYLDRQYFSLSFDTHRSVIF